MADKKGGYIDKFLKKADRAIQEGIKKADEALDEAVEIGSITAKQAAKTSKELHKKALHEKETLQKKGIKKINDSLTSVKKITASSQDNLEVLEKLGKLRKSGIITEKEFQAKKKEVLERI